MDRIKKDGADIVNVSSSVGTKAYESQTAYGASKWAMRGFSANLQLELKKTPCRVISFCPGGFISNLVKNFNGQEIDDPQNWMSARDVAKCIKQILELPKNMEVSEIILNRKLNT
jgi:NADP-dependent 3-hydroxy acid dehydrogenase YdfG